MHHIAIFASGNGSNFQRIVDFFKGHTSINITVLVCDNPNAYALERAKKEGVPAVLIDKNDLKDPQNLFDSLKEYQVDFIVLAGFLRKIPNQLVEEFPNKIINIHPALLPNYGGKGMYGHRVHEAVIANHEKESGITIHYVNEHYDEGAIIKQYRCEITPNDTSDTLAAKIHELEYAHFPEVIESLLK